MAIVSLELFESPSKLPTSTESILIVLNLNIFAIKYSFKTKIEEKKFYG